MYDQLKTLAGTTGVSMADILKIGMSKVAVEAGAAYEKGEREGFDIAREMFEVVYNCAMCGREHLSVDTPEQQEAAAKMMTQAGWHGLECR